MSEKAEAEGSREHAFIGRCEVLFCIDPAEHTVYDPLYGRDLVVCDDCYRRKTTDENPDEGSKRAQLGEFAKEVFDDE